MKRCTFFLFVAMMVAMSDAKVSGESITIEGEFVFYEYNDIAKKQIKKEALVSYE